MSLLKAEDNKKWIHAFVAVVAILAGFLCIRFLNQLGEWFDLEAKIENYLLVSQGVGIALGLGTFLGVTRHKKASRHMQEVYDELVKAVWPKNDSVIKSTAINLVALTILSGIFLTVDFIFRQLLGLLY